MNIFFPQHQEVLEALLTHEVRFLLIGGYAVILHGHTRTTGDLDLWLEPSAENQIRVCKAMDAMGYDTDDIQHLSELDFTEATVFSIGIEPQKIDFLTKVNLVTFDEAYRQRQTVTVENLAVPLVRRQDLVLMKMNTGRLKDKADVEALQKTQKPE